MANEDEALVLPGSEDLHKAVKALARFEHRGYDAWGISVTIVYDASGEMVLGQQVAPAILLEDTERGTTPIEFMADEVALTTFEAISIANSYIRNELDATVQGEEGKRHG